MLLLRSARVWVLLLMVLSLVGYSLSFGGGDTDKALEQFQKPIKPTEPLLPPDVSVAEDFKPGVGEPIGTVESAMGTVYVIHKNEKIAYKVKRGVSLFAEDTLITDADGKTQLRLNDKSAIALAEYSKLTLNRIKFDATKNERTSMVELKFGKGRFKMQKLSETGSFEVKTPSAVAGVRGSDFALLVYPEAPKSMLKNKVLAWLSPVATAHAVVPVFTTAIITGELTTVSFAGLVGPAQLVGPFSMSVAVTGGAATSTVFVGAAVATSTLNAVGPGLAVMSMPPHM